MWCGVAKFSYHPIHPIYLILSSFPTVCSSNPSSIVQRLCVLLDGSLKRSRVRANDLADLLAVLEQDEGGHGAHGELLGDIGQLVDVDLVEAGVGVGVGEPVGCRLLVDVWEDMEGYGE